MVKIQSIEYFRVLPRWLFVKITDEEGQYGWGESTLEGHTEAVEGTLNALCKRFVGYEAEYVVLALILLGTKLTSSPATLSTSGRWPGALVSIEVVPSSCLPSPASILPSGI